MRRRKIFLPIVFLLSFSFALADSSIGGANQVNKCEVNTYTITIENSSSQPITDIVVHNFMPTPGFTYVPGSSSLSAPGCSSTSDPSVNGNELIWDIDSICGSGITLNPGQSLTIDFAMETHCDAVSGSDNVHVDYNIGGSPSSEDTSLSIEVLPGALTITKTPSVVSASVGENVTWTIKVENTGIGKIKNVEITDVLGAGLSLVSTNPSGNVNGQTITWNSSNISQLAEMNPGDYVEITVEAQVVSCENLDNVADARWGCDGGATCFDTSVDGGTATASVQLVNKSPSLDFTPPDINFTYCEDNKTVSFPITNNGDGRAHDVKICVDFGPLSVISVTPPATYTNGCFNIPDLGPGDNYNLEFTLGYSDWCQRPLPSGTLLWQPNYKDDCNNDFYPPVKLSSYNAPSDSPELSVSKTGPEEIQIGSQATYHITVDYSGVTSCGSGSTGTVQVTDHVPDGFTVVDAGGGTWTPGAGGTGGTITWTFDPSSSPHFETDITLQAPGADQCEGYCFTTFENTVEASVQDCCGCDLSASASQTTAIECEQLVDSEKTANPSTAQKCEEITYTNQYDFTDSSALDGVDLSDLHFEENADNNQQYVSGSLSVVFDGADVTSCVSITDNTPGGHLILDFSGCTGYGSVRNKSLTITYNLRITDQSQPSPPCGNSSTFYSWSTLDLGITGGDCLQDGRIHETTEVTVEPPAMSVSLNGMPTVVEKCGTYDVDLVVERTSTVGVPYDVVVRLNTDNYYVVSVNGYDGVNPVSGPVDHGTYIEWDYGDNFSSANQGTIHLTVQKRCEGGPTLTATAYYDDQCHNNDQCEQSCSASDTYTPPLMTSGDLIITKTPEVYYASTNTVQWKIYLINRGNGTAYNVWLDDILGAGLTYNSATVDNMDGVTINPNQDHTGGSINGVGILINSMAPAERREITITANLVDCDNLTNDVSSSWGCLGGDCNTPVSDNSTVKIPAPVLVGTNNIPTPINACSEETAVITIKNAGQTTVYNLEVTETLPPGLSYVPGTTEWRKNGGSWSPGSDPNPMTSPIKWTKNELPVLSDLSPGDTVEIRFHVVSDCDFQGGDVVFELQYENPCGKVFSTSPSTFHVDLNEPNVSITKTRITPPEGEPLDCNQNVTWQIQVTNHSGYTLPVLWVEDVLGGAFSYISSTGDPTYGPADNGYNSGQNVYW